MRAVSVNSTGHRPCPLRSAHCSLAGFSDADVASASTHFRASSSAPAIEVAIDWILAHPQPAAVTCQRGVAGGVAGAAAQALLQPSSFCNPFFVCDHVYCPDSPAVASASAVSQGPQEGQLAAGTRISVTDFGQVYTTNDRFIDRLGIRGAAGFHYGSAGSEEADGEHGVVLSSILWSDSGAGGIVKCVYAIRMDQSSRVFIIGSFGIESVKSVPVIAPEPGPHVRNVGAVEFEYFPHEASVVEGCRHDVAITRTAIDVNGVIPSVDGILPHIPTVARAFRERLRSCPNPATFSNELLQLWNILFRSRYISPCLSPLVVTHAAAFEFAINELLLACEECRFIEPVISEESKMLAPLQFLKQDAVFLEIVSQQFGLAASVSSVRCHFSVQHFLSFVSLKFLFRCFRGFSAIFWPPATSNGSSRCFERLPPLKSPVPTMTKLPRSMFCINR